MTMDDTTAALEGKIARLIIDRNVWRGSAEHTIAQNELLRRRLRILEQAINWTVVEMERDCHPDSIGEAWRNRLADALRRANDVPAMMI
jgi:hypothetical protein